MSMEELEPVFEFLSTPSARRATDGKPVYTQRVLISIHALREEGDSSADTLAGLHRTFLSTPSARRATKQVYCFKCGQAFISIHALREEGDSAVESYHSILRYFYPRPPRGGRHSRRTAVKVASIFLSTPSARRATGMMAMVT